MSKEVQTLEKEVNKVKVFESITTPEQMTIASDARAQLKAFEKKVTEEKEKVTKPMNAALKAARALFKPVEDRIESGLSIINRAMIAYQTEQMRLAKIEEEKITNRVGTGKGKLTVETAVRKLDEIEKPDKKVTSAIGGTEFIAVKCFEVTDLSILPIEYHVADEVKIRAAMKQNIELDGVKYWIEQRPRNI